MGVWYASVDDVRYALKDTTVGVDSDMQIARALESASRQVEALLHRRFYPATLTRQWDWPSSANPTSWRLWVDSDQGEPISLSAVTTENGATTLDPASYFLRSSSNSAEPPYDQLQIDLGGSGSFSSGTSRQRAIAGTGIFGYNLDSDTAGATAEALDAVEVDVDVTDSSRTPVGALLTVDSERMIVTARTWLTTGQTVQTAALTASLANTSVLVTSGAAVHAGETVLIDAEKMLVTDVSGNALTVRRAQQGTPLATHNTGTTLYAPRTLTVTRAALGTTAATHLTAAPLTRQRYPGPVEALTVAYAINNVLQESGGYARIVGTGDNAREFTGRGIRELERDAFAGYGRVRTGAA